MAEAKVQKVVIGIHDPNLGVCGKGFLRLQEANIETELFPRDLAEEIKRMNREFILAQQRIGLIITHPENNEELSTEPKSGITLKGKWTNPPREGESVYAIVKTGDSWWPHGELKSIPGVEGERETWIGIGSACKHTVFIGRLNRLGKALFDYYRRVIEIHRDWKDHIRKKFEDPNFEFPSPDWIAIKIDGNELRKGIDVEDSISFNITKLVLKQA